MALIDAFARLCGTGQEVRDLDPGEVSSAWFDAGALQERVLGAGQLVVAKFGCTVTATTDDPDNVVYFSIAHSPKELATPTAARTFTFTAEADDELITAASHGLANGTRVVITATAGIPTNLAVDTNYFVRDASTNTFKLAATPGGAAIDITTDGTAPHTMRWYPEIIASTGPVAWNRLVANAWTYEIALNPFWRATGTSAPLQAVPYGRYIYAFFHGTSDLTAGTFTCDMTTGFSTDGRPQQKISYVTM